MNERRRDKRLATDFPAVLKVGKKNLPGRAVNVSFHGIGVALGEMPTLRQLVQVELELPSGKMFSAHMMVVHVEGNVAGLEFFGKSNNPDWDDLIHTLGRPGSGQTTAPTEAGSSPRGGYGGMERRRAPRIALQLTIRLRTSRGLHAAETTDVSMIGATLVVNELSAGVGEAVVATLTLPGTHFTFRRDGVIRRVTEGPGGRIICGVEFAPLEPMREVLFAEFMNTAYAARGQR